MEYDVIIIGGGVAGLSAAQELAEKNVKVCVLEASPFVGGKPISAFALPLEPPTSLNSNDEFLSAKAIESSQVKQSLPIEHGFRVYPENYYNLQKIMQSIPVEEGKMVIDCFTNTVQFAEHVTSIPKNIKWIDRILSHVEKYFFGLALFTPYVLCEERALKFDEISIEKLFGLQNRSPELREVILLLTDSLSSGMVANTSSLAVVNILMNFFYAPDRAGFRTFDRPTHLAWLNPWEKYLEKLKVTIFKNSQVINIQLTGIEEDHFDHVKISEITAIQEGVEKRFKAKYIISAIPADALKRLFNKNYEMLRYDSRLLDIYKIVTLPATGVQLYYEKPIHEFANKIITGSMVTHPWGLSIVDQTCYWHDPKKYAGSYGVVSIYLSITNQMGRYVKKSMQKCTLNEIAYEMFKETENILSVRGVQTPKRVGYFAQSYSEEHHQVDDPVVSYHFNGNIQDQLHLCIVGMRKWRPKPETVYLGNLILAGAYTQTNSYHVSTMEGACESGRRAANTILQKLGIPSIKIYQIEGPKHIQFLRKLDRFLYTFWLPNPLVLIMKFLRFISRNKNRHMDPKIRSYEKLHW